MANRKIKIGDYCEIIKGGIGIQKAIKGEFPLVVTAEKRLSHNEFQFDCKAVLVPLVSSTGHGHASLKRVHYQEGKFALGTILCAIIVKDENIINPKFLHIYLSYFKDHLLVPLMKGAANVTLSIKKIKTVEIVLPSIERQLEIIELEKNNTLSDELNSEIQTQKLLLTQLKQSILQEAIQGKLTADWRIQNPNTEPANKLLKRIKAEKKQLIADKKIKKEKPLPPITKEEIPFELPEDWVWCRLGEVSDIQRGSSPRPKGDKRYFSQEKTKNNWISISDISKYSVDNILLNVREYLTDLGTKYSRRVEKNEFIIAVSGSTTGKCCLTGIDGYIYDGLAVVKFFNKNILNEFLLKYMLQLYAHINNSKEGSSFPNINTTFLNNMLFPFPPLSEQKEIVKKVEKLMQHCQALEHEIKTSETNAQMLMQAVLKKAFANKEEQVKTKDTLFESENYDIYVAMIIQQIENRSRINYGEVALQKTVFNFNTFTLKNIPYQFINSNYGTFSPQLKEDLKKNPYLTKINKGYGDVFAVKKTKNKDILDAMTTVQNKSFMVAINKVLDIYEMPFINKETDKIELLNTVTKCILDTKTNDLEKVYQAMQNWEIKQKGYKTKADKFSKLSTKKMLQLIDNLELMENTKS